MEQTIKENESKINEKLITNLEIAVKAVCL